MKCFLCDSEVGPFYPLSEGILICHTCKALGKAPHTDDTERPQEHTDTEPTVSEQENTDTNQTEAEPENTDKDQQTESKPQRKKTTK